MARSGDKPEKRKAIKRRHYAQNLFYKVGKNMI